LDFLLCGEHNPFKMSIEPKKEESDKKNPEDGEVKMVPEGGTKAAHWYFIDNKLGANSSNSVGKPVRSCGLNIDLSSRAPRLQERRELPDGYAFSSTTALRTEQQPPDWLAKFESPLCRLS
jgi:hypothetical protein